MTGKATQKPSFYRGRGGDYDSYVIRDDMGDECSYTIERADPHRWNLWFYWGDESGNDPIGIFRTLKAAKAAAKAHWSKHCSFVTEAMNNGMAPVEWAEYLHTGDVPDDMNEGHAEWLRAQWEAKQTAEVAK